MFGIKTRWRFAFAVASLLLMLAVFAAPSQAAPRTTSPQLDFKGDLFTVPNGTGIPTSSTWVTVWGSPYVPPTWGAPASIFPWPHNVSAPYGAVINTFGDFIILHNGDSFGNDTARYMAGLQYISYDDTALPDQTMTVTTVYGVDAEPLTPDALALTGYDLSRLYPELSDERIIGPTGTVYPAGAGQLVPISDLSAVLGSSFDLSPFGGDPSLSVYVFQTAVPFSEAVVPEPGTAGLLLGGALVGLLWWRKRSAA